MPRTQFSSSRGRLRQRTRLFARLVNETIAFAMCQPDWTTHLVELPGHSFQLEGPASPDELLDELTEDDRSCPYWAALWPAAIEMAEFVVRRKWPTGATAIELGCGLGLVGIAGLAAGLRVTLTDLVPRAVEVARRNAARNGLTPSATREVDWRCPPADKFQLVLACDVLYDRDLHPPLLETIDTVLDPGGTCWLGEPGRSAADSFLEAAEARGFGVRAYDREANLCDSFSLNQFRVFELRRRDDPNAPAAGKRLA